MKAVDLAATLEGGYASPSAPRPESQCEVSYPGVWVWPCASKPAELAIARELEDLQAQREQLGTRVTALYMSRGYPTGALLDDPRWSCAEAAADRTELEDLCVKMEEIECLADGARARAEREVVNDSATLEPLPTDAKASPAELGHAYLSGHHVIAARGDLLVYHDGYYQPGANAAIREWALRQLGNGARKRDGDELVYWLSVACAVDAATLDPGDLVNVSNGLLEWRRGELRSHTPEALSTVQIPTEWRADAYHERGDRFLEEVLPDAETRAVVEEFLGYCLLPDCRYQRALMLTGAGSNGKSVLLSWLTATLGKDNVGGVKLQDLEHRFRAADLVGKLANISADLPRTAVEDSGPFKMLATGDRFQVERKYRDPSTFANRAKLLFSANELPGTRDRSDAFFRRWLIVPFERQFDEGNPARDPALLDKLCSPECRSYLLRLAVEGARRLVARGHFQDTTATTEARSEYRRQADNIVGWFEEECAYVAGENWTTKSAAYESYRKWCEAGGQVPATESILAKRLRAIEPRIQPARRGGRGDGRLQVWLGLSVGVSGVAAWTPGTNSSTEPRPSEPVSGVAGVTPTHVVQREKEEEEREEREKVREMGGTPATPDTPIPIPGNIEESVPVEAEPPLTRGLPTGYPEAMAQVDAWPVELRKRWAARALAIREVRGCAMEEAELAAARELAQIGGAA